MKRLRCGTEIVCPQCELEIAVVKTTIMPGTLMKQDYFDFKIEKPKDGQKMYCPSCGTSYGLLSGFGTGMVHTREGWQ